MSKFMNFLMINNKFSINTEQIAAIEFREEIGAIDFHMSDENTYTKYIIGKDLKQQRENYIKYRDKLMSILSIDRIENYID